MIYLIDFENVHEEGFSALGRLGDKDAVYCFFTRNVAKISMSALAGIRSGQLHFIEAESGKQSLDLVLVSYLGYLIGTRPQELYYDIVSNDNGFAKVAEFWNKRGNGLRVRIRKTNDLKQKSETVKVQLQPADAVATEILTEPKQENQKTESPKPNQPKQRSRQKTQRQRSAKQEQQLPSAPSSAPAAATSSASVPSSVAEDTIPPRADETKGLEIKTEEEKTPLKQQELRSEEKSVQKQAETRKENLQNLQPTAKTAEVQKLQPDVKPAKTQKAQPVNKPAETQKLQSEAQSAVMTKSQTEAKVGDPNAAAALESAGLNAAAIEFIQAQVEKYRDDKNMKQLVYRAVVKKYGQKNGTQIYNSAKKQLLK